MKAEKYYARGSNWGRFVEMSGKIRIYNGFNLRWERVPAAKVEIVQGNLGVGRVVKVPIEEWHLLSEDALKVLTMGLFEGS